MSISSEPVQPGETTPYPNKVRAPSSFPRRLSNEETSYKPVTEFQKILEQRRELQPNLMSFPDVRVLVVEDMDVLHVERNLKFCGFAFEGRCPIVLKRPAERQESLEDIDLGRLEIGEEQEPQIYRAKTAEDAIWAVLESRKIFHFIFMDNQLTSKGKLGFDAAQELTTAKENTKEPVPTMFSISSSSNIEDKYKHLFKADLGKSPTKETLQDVLLKYWPQKA
jgi:hypothetical protein